MTNVNAHHQGRKVVALATRTRRHAVDFPGWGAANYADFLLPIPEGTAGVITAVNSHGSNPWTRYNVRFTDGTTASNLILASPGLPRGCTGDFKLA